MCYNWLVRLFCNVQWFLDHMAQDDWWPQQILIRCPQPVVRQLCHRLLIHVITQLQAAHSPLYLRTDRYHRRGG